MATDAPKPFLRLFPRRPDHRETFMMAHGAVMLTCMFGLMMFWPEDDDGGVRAIALYFLAWMASIPVAWFLSGMFGAGRRTATDFAVPAR